MKQFGVVHQFAIHKGKDSLFDIDKVSDHGLDVQTAHDFIRAHAHTASQQGLAIRDGFSHAGVFTV